MKPRDEERVRHLLDALREARELLATDPAADVARDRKLALALVKLIEIAGEAAANVSSERQRSQPCTA